MASQRRAPSKRPPRPAAKTSPPPPGPADGADGASGTTGATSAATGATSAATGATGATSGTTSAASGTTGATAGAETTAGPGGTGPTNGGAGGDGLEAADTAAAAAGSSLGPKAPDATSSVGTATKETVPPGSGTVNKARPAPTKSGGKGTTRAGGTTAKSGSTTAKSGSSTAKSGSTTAKSGSTMSRAGATTAKDGAPRGRPGSGAPKPGPSGPTYRPPTGAARTASRRPPPRKKSRWNRKTIMAGVGIVLIATLVIFFAFAVNGASKPASTALGETGPETIPIPNGPVLAAANTAQYPGVIDGISCNTTEQLVYHIHVHLTIFVDGSARQVPYGIGITPPLTVSTTDGTFVDSGTCFYWLHTHANDGIIHVESPTQKTYTLGQFFDEWGQSLSNNQVGPAQGHVTIYQDGKLYTGNPRNLQLTAHNQIQLDVGSPAPPQTLLTNWGQL